MEGGGPAARDRGLEKTVGEKLSKIQGQSCMNACMSL